MATKSQEILLKGNTTNASAVPSSLKVREIAINALDRSLFTNDGNSIVKLYTGTNKWFDVNGNANNALKLGGILASEYINKETFNSHINNSVIHITAEERSAWNNKWDYNEETIKGVKVNAAVLSDKATKLATARTIYGQSFDGTKDIDGYIKVNVGISPDTIADYIGLRLHRSVANSDKWGVGLMLSAYQNKGIVIIGNGLGGQISYYDGTSNTSLISFLSSGNILIGTTTDNGYKLDVNGKGHYSDDLTVDGEVVAVAGDGTPAGVTDYSALTGKPSINGVTLVSGNNTLASLGIQAAGDYATNSGVTTLLADYAKKTFVANNYAGKAAFNSHIADTNIHITSTERTAWNAKWDYNEETIKAVKVTSASSADSVAWTGIKDKPTTFTPSAHTHTASEVSGLPTSLKNPYALSFGSKTYDGSAAATITASDLGALTAHQSIYAFTLQVNGTSQGVYNPASAAKTINIAVPTKTSDITNDSGFITSASIPTALKNPYAVEIKANGVSLGTYDGSDAATFNLSAANVGAASKVHSHTASEISGLPTNLSAFNNDVGYITGITKSMVEGVLTGNITSHTHSYLPLSGGTIKGDILSSNMDVGIRWNVDYVGGWSRNFLEFNAHKDNDATKALESVFKIGGYGQDTGYVFTYIGANSYNSAYNIRFYSNNTITIGTYEILHANNYNSYAPTLTGTGASGTWGIDISGNASSATKLQTSGGVICATTDGSGNVTFSHEIFISTDRAVRMADSSGVYQNAMFVLGSTLNIGYDSPSINIGNKIYINSSGNILIGTTTDSGYKLQVNGSERVYGNLIVDGEVSALVA